LLARISVGGQFRETHPDRDAAECRELGAKRRRHSTAGYRRRDNPEYQLHQPGKHPGCAGRLLRQQTALLKQQTKALKQQNELRKQQQAAALAAPVAPSATRNPRVGDLDTVTGQPKFATFAEYEDAKDEWLIEEAVRRFQALQSAH